MNYILDYQGKKTILPFDIEDEKVKEAHIDVITGDEILHAVVEQEDGSLREEIYDSSGCRLMNFFDCSCELKFDGKVEYPDDEFETRDRAYGYY